MSNDYKRSGKQTRIATKKQHTEPKSTYLGSLHALNFACHWLSSRKSDYIYIPTKNTYNVTFTFFKWQFIVASTPTTVPCTAVPFFSSIVTCSLLSFCKNFTNFIIFISQDSAQVICYDAILYSQRGRSNCRNPTLIMILNILILLDVDYYVVRCTTTVSTCQKLKNKI